MDAVVIGVAYAVALMSYKSSLNPARALGSAFVSSEEDRCVQGSDKRWSPGCVSAAGKARQKW